MAPHDDYFMPENIDEQIDAFFQAPTNSSTLRSPTRDERLLEDLQKIHQLPSNGQHLSVQRAWQRIVAESTDEDVSQQSTQELRPIREIRSRHDQHRSKSHSRFFPSARLTTLVAASVVMVLLGSFMFAIAHIPQNTGTPALHPTPVPTTVHIQPRSTPTTALVPTTAATTVPTPTQGPISATTPTQSIATPTSTPASGNTPIVAPTLPVKPLTGCIIMNSDGSYIAYFTYINQNTSDVTIPVGSNNYFFPDPADRGQATLFKAGTQYNAVRVNVSGGNVVWGLSGRTATMTPQSPLCH